MESTHPNSPPIIQAGAVKTHKSFTRNGPQTVVLHYEKYECPSTISSYDMNNNYMTRAYIFNGMRPAIQNSK